LCICLLFKVCDYFSCINQQIPDFLQQVALSEVHLVRARCPHHKSFIINICTS
jgi:hypothetical protein